MRGAARAALPAPLPMPFLRRLARLATLHRRLRRDEWGDIARAQLAVVVAHVVVAVTPRGRLARGDASRPAAADAPPAGELARAHALARAVRRVARYGLTRPLCLVRSVALLRLLHAAGLQAAELRVGVRREGASLLAHAWVELGGVALDDDPSSVRGFVALPGVHLRKGRA